MFSLIVLLSFSCCLETKHLFLLDEKCMVRPTLTDINPLELKYYLFVISIDKCTGSCNILSPKICVSKETKDTYFKAFNMITNKNEAKAITRHISCNCKCIFNSTTCNSNQKWNNKTCQCACKNYYKCKEDYSWNPSTCICKNSKDLKSIADSSVTECNEILIVIDNVTTNAKTTKKTNAMSTASINCYCKKVRDCYILHTVLLVIILILKITIICYHCARQKGIT